MVRDDFHMEIEGRHVHEEPLADEPVGVEAQLRAMAGRAVEEAGHGAHRLPVGGHAKVVERNRHRLSPEFAAAAGQAAFIRIWPR